MFKMLVLAMALTGCNACKTTEEKPAEQPTEYDQARCLASCKKLDVKLDCEKLCPAKPEKKENH